VDLKNQIVDEVEKYLKNEDLTQGMRKTLVEKIMDLVKNKIVPEIGVGTTAYKEFLAATEEAVKTITKK
jgi:predicted nucleic acid-binding OB-fold protein